MPWNALPHSHSPLSGCSQTTVDEEAPPPHTFCSPKDPAQRCSPFQAQFLTKITINIPLWQTLGPTQSSKEKELDQIPSPTPHPQSAKFPPPFAVSVKSRKKTGGTHRLCSYLGMGVGQKKAHERNGRNSKIKNAQMPHSWAGWKGRGATAERRVQRPKGMRRNGDRDGTGEASGGRSARAPRSPPAAAAHGAAPGGRVGQEGEEGAVSGEPFTRSVPQVSSLVSVSQEISRWLFPALFPRWE